MEKADKANFHLMVTAHLLSLIEVSNSPKGQAEVKLEN